ncbi:DRAM2 [Acanthosepion pharaonis]|uniref:DRAM2 n=1 Tax=Acanthosepion pharaonis TaxID=158019 RepID=A0A812AU64_ACAPH|nr:DRAM2 [Sepia pharaonis]
MWGQRLWLFPIVVFIAAPVFFLITYAIAVAFKHVDPGFPYISDTGTYPPESCVFGQLLNILALLIGMTLYIRYRQVDEMYKNSGRRHLIFFNKFAFGIGLLAAMGVSIVANFQESNVLIGHVVGAVLAFALGTLGYGWLQTIISYRTRLPGSSHTLCHFRLSLCLFGSVLFLVGIIASDSSFKKKKFITSAKHWKPTDEGYAEHLVATISEWLLAILNVAYLLTFLPEFKLFSMDPPQLTFHSNQAIVATADELALEIAGESPNRTSLTKVDGKTNLKEIGCSHT